MVQGIQKVPSWMLPGRSATAPSSTAYKNETRSARSREEEQDPYQGLDAASPAAIGG